MGLEPTPWSGAHPVAAVAVGGESVRVTRTQMLEAQTPHLRSRRRFDEKKIKSGQRKGKEVKSLFLSTWENEEAKNYYFNYYENVFY